MQAGKATAAQLPQDAAGRYSLNVMHAAAGNLARDKPSEWLRTAKAQEMVAEAKAGFPALDPVAVQKGGAYPGVWVCRELVYAYAMWISPKAEIRPLPRALAGAAPSRT